MNNKTSNSEQSPKSLRLEAARLKNKAAKIHYDEKKYIEIMRQVWSLNILAASLES